MGLPTDMIKGGVCGSGTYHLTPVRLSAHSNYVKFDDATVTTFSPIRVSIDCTRPLIVAYGTCETPNFSGRTAILLPRSKPPESR